MTVVLWLLAVQGVLGAFDTIWYHEVRAQLPGGGARARPELRLHAVRSAFYAVIFATLAWWEWRGALAIVLALILVAEIAITLADFVVEDDVRRPLGGVFPGERAMHAVMGIVYGAMLGSLLPAMAGWASQPTGFAASAAEVPAALRVALTVMGAGVLASAARDAAAATFRGAWARWPWPAWPAA